MCPGTNDAAGETLMTWCAGSCPRGENSAKQAGTCISHTVA